MKLLYLPLIYEGSNNEQKYLAKAFGRQFSEVATFDYMSNPHPNDDFMTFTQQFKPDVIHCQFQGTNRIEPFCLAHIKAVYPNIVITQWTGDVRPEPIPEVVNYGKYCDLTLVCSTTDIEAYERAGVKQAAYWQNAVDETQFTRPSKKPKGIAFCGGRYTHFSNSQQRIALVEKFQKTFGDDMTVYGFGWQPHQILPWDDQPQLYATKELVLGHNNVPGKRWWFSDRQMIAMASGRPHLCQYSEDLELLFDDMVHCVFYYSIDEAIEKAEWLRKHPDEASQIGLAGQALMREKYTWDTRVSEYIAILKDHGLLRA